MAVTLETARLVLRSLEPGDLSAVFEVLSDTTTTAAVSWRQPSRESAEQWLGRRLDDQRRTGFGMLALVPRGSRALIGLAGFFPRDTGLELGYVVHARYWRQGFASEAVQALVTHAVSAGQCVFATIRPDNQPSLRVAESAGLRFARRKLDAEGELLVYERAANASKERDA